MSATVSLYVVHLSLDNPADRRAQINHLINEARKESSDAVFIAGDYNANLGHLRDNSFPNSADENWMLNLRTNSNWMTLDTVCVRGPQQTREHFSGDKMHLAQLDGQGSVRVRPFAYMYDADPNGAPIRSIEPVNFPHIAHGAHGVLYSFEKK